jgi:hypothetical protein
MAHIVSPNPKPGVSNLLEALKMHKAREHRSASRFYAKVEKAFGNLGRITNQFTFSGITPHEVSRQLHEAGFEAWTMIERLGQIEIRLLGQYQFSPEQSSRYTSFVSSPFAKSYATKIDRQRDSPRQLPLPTFRARLRRYDRIVHAKLEFQADLQLSDWKVCIANRSLANVASLALLRDRTSALGNELKRRISHVTRRGRKGSSP